MSASEQDWVDVRPPQAIGKRPVEVWQTMHFAHSEHIDTIPNEWEPFAATGDRVYVRRKVTRWVDDEQS